MGHNKFQALFVIVMLAWVMLGGAVGFAILYSIEHAARVDHHEVGAQSRHKR